MPLPMASQTGRALVASPSQRLQSCILVASKPLGIKHTARSRALLLTSRVQQAEREAPTAPTTKPDDPSPSSTTSSDDPHRHSHHAKQHDESARPQQPEVPRAADSKPSTSSDAADGPSGSPRLPPRRQRLTGPGPDMRRPIMFQRPGAQALLATYGAYIGAVGTMAVGAAWAADINLAAMFRWSPEVVQNALVALLPLAALNTAIMLPDYSTWALPKLDSQDPEDAAFTQQQGQTTASASLSSTAKQDKAAPTLPSEGGASTQGTESSSSGSGTAKVDVAGGFVRLGASGSKPGMVPASSWGQRKPPLRIIKDAMHLAQGHYTANNPTVDVQPGVELGLSVAQSLAGELLYRGVAITLLQGWLLDRFYEAGADDILSLPLLSSPMDTRDAAGWAAAWLLIALSVGLAVRKVIAAPRPRIATIVDLRSAARRGGSADADGAAGRGLEAQGKSADGVQGTGAESGTRAGTGAGPDSPASSSAPGGKPALDGPLTPRAPQPGWAPLGFQQVTTLAAAIQGSRNVAQTLIFNCLFVASGGNLAATFTASLANQLLFSVLQRQSMQRMQKRSSALAKELEVLNKRLKEIHRKNKARLSEIASTDADAAAAASRLAQSSAEAEKRGGSAGHDTSPRGVQDNLQGDRLQSQLQGQEEASDLASVSGSGSGADSQEAEAGLLHAAAIATAVAASAADASSSVVSAAAAAAVGVGAGSGASGGGSGVATQPPDQLTRALMALDRLLPPEPAGAAKGKPGPKQ